MGCLLCFKLIIKHKHRPSVVVADNNEEVAFAPLQRGGLARGIENHLLAGILAYVATVGIAASNSTHFTMHGQRFG